MRRAGGLRGAGPPPVYFQKIRRPQMSSETPILEMKNITKVYANGIVANRQVHFSVRKGEIHGLIGENGAGKSTLMNILFGGQQADEGSILLDGKAIEIHSPMQAIGYGIGMVHQHYALVPSMTVAENVFLGDEPRTRHGLIDRETEVKRTKELSDLYHFQLNPSDVVRDLSVGTKQKIEILDVNSVDAEGKPTKEDVRYLLLTMPEVNNERYDVLKNGVDALYNECKAAMELANNKFDMKLTPLLAGESQNDLDRLKKERDRLNTQWTEHREKIYNDKMREIEFAHNLWMADRVEETLNDFMEKETNNESAAHSMRLDPEDYE